MKRTPPGRLKNDWSDILPRPRCRQQDAVYIIARLVFMTVLKEALPSFLRSFVPPFLHYFIPPFLRSFIASFFDCLIASFFHCFIPSFLRSFVLSFLRSFVLSFLRSFVSQFPPFINHATVRGRRWGDSKKSLSREHLNDHPCGNLGRTVYARYQPPRSIWIFTPLPLSSCFCIIATGSLRRGCGLRFFYCFVSGEKSVAQIFFKEKNKQNDPCYASKVKCLSSDSKKQFVDLKNCNSSFCSQLWSMEKFCLFQTE